MKEEAVIDTSTRNFYNNMYANTATNNNDSRQVATNNNNDSTSYYATYTSKLYDNDGDDKKDNYISSANTNAIANTNTNAITNTNTNTNAKSKYALNLDDGMSSPDFLAQLQNLKFTSPVLATSNSGSLTSNSGLANSNSGLLTSNNDLLTSNSGSALNAFKKSETPAYDFGTTYQTVNTINKYGQP